MILLGFRSDLQTNVVLMCLIRNIVAGFVYELVPFDTYYMGSNVGG